MAEMSGKGSVAGSRKRKSRLVAACLAIFFGFLGVHKFYLRQIKAGLIQLVVFFVAWFAAAATGILWLYHAVFFAAVAFGIAEGVLYTRLTDEEFYRVHVEGRRAWPCLEGTFTLNSWRDVVVYVLAAMLLFSWATTVFGSATEDATEATEESAVAEEEAAEEETTEEDASEEDDALSEAEELAAEKETEGRETAVSDDDGLDADGAEEEASEEAETETEEASEVASVSYAIDCDDFDGELSIEFVEVTDEGVVFSFTTTVDMGYLDMTLISVEGSTYRQGDVYDDATDSDDYEFGIFTWSDYSDKWICGVPALTLYADETELYMFSWPENVEFETMTIYCSWSEYILNSSGTVTSGPYTFEGYTITFTKK